MKKYLLSALMVAAISAQSQPQTPGSRIVKDQFNLIGLADSRGNIVVEPQYDHATLAPARHDASKMEWVMSASNCTITGCRIALDRYDAKTLKRVASQDFIESGQTPLN